jgi:hypothetical protein
LTGEWGGCVKLRGFGVPQRAGCCGWLVWRYDDVAAAAWQFDEVFLRAWVVDRWSVREDCKVCQM